MCASTTARCFLATHALMLVGCVCFVVTFVVLSAQERAVTSTQASTQVSTLSLQPSQSPPPLSPPTSPPLSPPSNPQAFFSVVEDMQTDDTIEAVLFFDFSGWNSQGVCSEVVNALSESWASGVSSDMTNANPSATGCAVEYLDECNEGPAFAAPHRSDTTPQRSGRRRAKSKGGGRAPAGFECDSLDASGNVCIARVRMTLSAPVGTAEAVFVTQSFVDFLLDTARDGVFSLTSHTRECTELHVHSAASAVRLD